jgi:hypothetical protein
MLVTFSYHLAYLSVKGRKEKEKKKKKFKKIFRSFQMRVKHEERSACFTLKSRKLSYCLGMKLTRRNSEIREFASQLLYQKKEKM